MVVYILAITDTLLKYGGGTLTGVTSKYYEMPGADLSWPVNMDLPYHHYPAKVVSNMTHRALLVNLPVGTNVCSMLQVIAPTMMCRSDWVTREEVNEHLDFEFVMRTFSLEVLDLNKNASVYNFILSNRVDWKYLLESTPAWLVNLTHPIVFDAECADCEKEPKWGEFFARGAVDTALNFGSYGATKYAMTHYRSYVSALMSRITGGGEAGGSVVIAGSGSPSAAGGAAAHPTTWSASTSGLDTSHISPEVVREAATDLAGVSGDVLGGSPSSGIGEFFELAPLSAELAPATVLVPTVGEALAAPAAFAPTMAAAVGGVASEAISAVGGVAVGESAAGGATSALTYAGAVKRGLVSTFDRAKVLRNSLVTAERRVRLENSDIMARRTLSALKRHLASTYVPPQAIQVVQTYGSSSAGSLAAASSVPLIQSAGAATASASRGLGLAEVVPMLLPKGRRRRALGKRGKGVVKTQVDKKTLSSTARTNATGNTTSGGASGAVSPVPAVGGGSKVSSSTAKPPPSTTSTTVSAQNTTTKSVKFMDTNALEDAYARNNMVLGMAGRLRRYGSSRQKRGIGAVVWSGLRSIPGWVYPAAGSAMGWGFASTSLQAQPIRRRYIHPVTFISQTERYYTAVASMILNACFFSCPQEIRIAIDGGYPLIRYRGKAYTRSDVVFDFNTMQGGELLHRCSPLFKMPYEGIPESAMKTSIYALFDSEILVGNVLFYNGPPRYIVEDYQHYYDSVFPKYDVYGTNKESRESMTDAEKNIRLAFLDEGERRSVRVRRNVSDDEGADDLTDGDEDVSSTSPRSLFKRVEVETTDKNVVGGATYLIAAPTSSHRSFLTLPAEYKTLSWMGSVDLVSRLDQLMSEPRFRYEMDVIQAIHYNTTASYYQNLRRVLNSNRLETPVIARRKEYTVPKGLGFRELINSLNPFDLSFPRLHLIRELINGYQPTRHLQRVIVRATEYGYNLKFANLTTMLALFYSTDFPDDDEGTRDISTATIVADEFGSLLDYLYTSSYARVPIVMIVQDTRDIKRLSDMFLTPVRTSTDITTWRYYSPFLITNSPNWIHRASHSVCISRRRRIRTALKGRFAGLLVSGNSRDMEFSKRCLMASMHVKYQSDISAIATNPFLHPRITTFLASNTISTEWMQEVSQPTHDPGLSEVLQSVKDLPDDKFYQPHREEGLVDREVSLPDSASLVQHAMTVETEPWHVVGLREDSVTSLDTPKYSLGYMFTVSACAFVVLSGLVAILGPCLRKLQRSHNVGGEVAVPEIELLAVERTNNAHLEGRSAARSSLLGLGGS